MSERGNDGGARQGAIGARLQAARERADLSQMQVAEELHVDPNVIQALETESFGALGPAVYVRGHLRHYAELVGESAPELLGLYAASMHAAPPPDLTRMPHARQLSSWRGALLTTGIAVVLAIGLIGSVRWIYLDMHPGAVATTTSIIASAPAALSAPPVAGEKP